MQLEELRPNVLPEPTAAPRGFVVLPTEHVTSPPTTTARLPRRVMIAAGLGVMVLLWAFWPTVDWLVSKWSADSSYSHGFLVPIMAGVLVYMKRERITRWFGQPQWYAAMGLLAVVVGLRLYAGGTLQMQLDSICLILSITAGVLTLGGWRLLKNCWQGLVFLPMMIPLTHEMETNVGGPLKTFATIGSTFLLQTFGYPAVNEGNVILIDDVRLGIVDACSGLKMLLGFAAIGLAAVLLLPRTWFEKFLILLSIVPIAVITNILRITATGVAYTFITDKDAQKAFHDGLGYFMLIVGLGFLMLELWVLNRLIVPPGGSSSTTPSIAPNVIDTRLTRTY